MPLLHPKIPFYIPSLFLMPHLSHDVLQLCSLCHILNYQLIWHKERQPQMEEAEDDSQIDNDEWEDMEFEDNMENMVDMVLFFLHMKLKNSCCSTGQVYWKWKFNFFKDDLGGHASSGASPAFLSDDEFQHKCRMKIPSFQKLVSLVQDHPVFHPPLDTHQKGQKQSPPAHQLMVFLYYLGTEASGASYPYLHNVYQIGHGTSEHYK